MNNERYKQMDFLFNKPIFATILTWLSGFTTLAGLLHLIPLTAGAFGAVCWALVAFYKFKKSKTESELKELELKHKLERFHKHQ
jgi:hypothetical protein